MGITFALAASTTLAFAQPPATTAPANQPGERQGGRAGGRGDGMDGRQMLMRMGAFQPPVVVTTNKYLIIIRGNTVYQLDINTLERLNTKELPMPEGFPMGPPPQPEGGMQQPPPPPPGGGRQQ